MTIVVPYRNRPDHLTQFIPHMRAYLQQAHIVVVEQEEGKPFNRGKLLNVGAIECPDTHWVFHDVDMLPVKVDYTESNNVRQLAKSNIQAKWYLGGVTMFHKAAFEMVGGYDNDYFHRAEDNSMWFNLIRVGIAPINRFGTFRTLPHPRTGPEFIPELWEKAKRPREVQDQLSVCQYEVLERREGEYTHLVVSI